jgi:repressor LexA
MEKKLTKKQKKILEFIDKFTVLNSYPPTFKELAEKFDITVGTMQDHIFALQKKGYIERKPDTARGIKIIKNPDGTEIEEAPESEYIPLYGNVAAGEPIFADNNIQGYVSIEKNKRGHKLHFALRVKGNSMQDAGIYDGDIVIVKKQDSADDGDVVIALIGDEATVKTLRNSKINAYLEAANSKYKAIIDRPFFIIGKVIELRRDYLNS